MAYWPVVGTTFAVTGPAPSTASVGTLTVGANDETDILNDLALGTYTVTETPSAGYTAAPPFQVAVPLGHATTTTTINNAIVPAVVDVGKDDAETGNPVAGAVIDLRYDSQDSGTYDVDLGQCTTDTSGTCSPPGNDGTTEFLPGDLEAIEISAPPGCFLPTPAPTTTGIVAPGGTLTLTVKDPLLVPASFQKVATGNFNATTVTYNGAVINVTSGSTPGGPDVTTCTTDASGTCTTPAVLVSGQPYCWVEVTAPPGLANGANGCFTADNAQGAQPITVTDAGLFVPLSLTKTDAQSPSTVLAGAVYDLFRVDGGTGPAVNATPPTGAATIPDQTWVARATTGTNGVAMFPLQYPGYKYCFLEVTPAVNYELNQDEVCTPGLVQGSVTTPPVAVNVTATDKEQPITIAAHKFDAASSTTGIPGAVYDLYVQGQGPPSRTPNGTTPTNAATMTGDLWWGRGTTDANGNLNFTVPAGYGWCFKEVTSPTNWTLDPGLHCMGVVTASSPPTALTVAIPEIRAMVNVYGHKFNSTTPNQAVPGATYELVGQGTPPAGWTALPNPNNLPVPTGDWFFGTATTNAQGIVEWTVPAGESWCQHETAAVPGYQLDTGWHCGPVINTTTTLTAATMALPEVPTPTPLPAPPGGGLLAFTGLTQLPMIGTGTGLGSARHRRDIDLPPSQAAIRRR